MCQSRLRARDPPPPPRPPTTFGGRVLRELVACRPWLPIPEVRLQFLLSVAHFHRDEQRVWGKKERGYKYIYKYI